MAVVADHFYFLEEGFGGGFFFDLFVDEPFEETSGGVVLFLDGQVHKFVDPGGDFAFVVQGALESAGGGVEILGRFFDGWDDGAAVLFDDVVVHFQGVSHLFGGLDAEPVGKAVEVDGCAV